MKAHNNLDIFDHHTSDSDKTMKAIHPENLDAQARILTAFVYRMSSHDLRTLADLVDEARHAGAQLGTSSQIKALDSITAMSKASLQRINSRDRSVAISIIQSVFTGDDQ